MRRQPIGKWHSTLGGAKKAALRAAKRLGHAHVKHWRDGRIETVFADGTTVPAAKPMNTYLVEYRPIGWPETEEPQVYRFEADDEEHAREQCENAEPGCTITHVGLFDN
jgi:hypothetical protein